MKEFRISSGRKPAALSCLVKQPRSALGQKLPPAEPGEDIIAYLRRINQFLTTRQVAEILNKHPDSVRRAIPDGFPALRDGHLWKHDSRRVADWLEKRSAGLI